MAELSGSTFFSQDDLATFERARQDRDAKNRHWPEAFADGDRILLPLNSEADQAQGLDERIAAVLTRYNQSPKDGITVESDPADPSKLIRYRDGKPLRRNNTHERLPNFLRSIDDPEAWLAAYDWEMERDRQTRSGEARPAGERPPGQRNVTFDEIKNVTPMSCVGIAPECLRVVISRDPMDIARMSTGRRWRSCMTKGSVNFHYVPKEIEAGTLVAYVVHQDDTGVDYPLMRILLKPFRNESGQTILVPNAVYPSDQANNTGVEGLLRQAIGGFIRQQNQGHSGTYSMDPEVYTDGQATSVTLGEKRNQPPQEIAKAMGRAVGGQVIEYVTEIEAAYNKGNESAVQQYTQQLRRLYSQDETARITHYLRQLRSVSIEQDLPSPEAVRIALKDRELQNALKSNEILANLYTKGGEAWNAYMQKEHPNLGSIVLRAKSIGIVGAEALARNSTLNSLNLTFNKVGDAGAEHLAKNSMLTSLNLDGNEIGDVGAEHLANNSTLTSLDLGNNRIRHAGATQLAKNRSLNSLILAYNQVGAEAAEHLAKSPTLTSLDLTGNIIGDLGAEPFAKNSTLTSLNLANNEIGDAGATHLAKNSMLTSLNLSFNPVGDIGAAQLAKNSTLIYLDLEGNEIGDIGAEHLSKNSTLNTLILASNQIGNAGASELAKNSTLTILDLSVNQIGAEGAAALAKNSTLSSLKVGGNSLGDLGAEHLAKNSTLTSLSLSLNKVSDAGAKHLAKNSTLTDLDLSFNQVSDIGAKHLATNSTLTYLYLGDNLVGDQGRRALINGLKHNYNLLYFSGPGSFELSAHLASNRQAAGQYVRRLIGDPDKPLTDTEKADIAARSNAILELLHEESDVTPERKAGTARIVREIAKSMEFGVARGDIESKRSDQDRPGQTEPSRVGDQAVRTSATAAKKTQSSDQPHRSRGPGFLTNGDRIVVGASGTASAGMNAAAIGKDAAILMDALGSGQYDRAAVALLDATANSAGLSDDVAGVLSQVKPETAKRLAESVGKIPGGMAKIAPATKLVGHAAPVIGVALDTILEEGNFVNEDGSIGAKGTRFAGSALSVGIGMGSAKAVGTGLAAVGSGAGTVVVAPLAAAVVVGYSVSDMTSSVITQQTDHERFKEQFDTKASLKHALQKYASDPAFKPYLTIVDHIDWTHPDARTLLRHRLSGECKMHRDSMDKSVGPVGAAVRNFFSLGTWGDSERHNTAQTDFTVAESALKELDALEAEMAQGKWPRSMVNPLARVEKHLCDSGLFLMDGSGTLVRDEKGNYQIALERLDRNGDGVLDGKDRDAVTKLLKSNGLNQEIVMTGLKNVVSFSGESIPISGKREKSPEAHEELVKQLGKEARNRTPHEALKCEDTKLDSLGRLTQHSPESQAINSAINSSNPRQSAKTNSFYTSRGLK
jgi:Leucine-rich repeat (LRR) protein